nr:hypothetical protein [uncultured Oscillibacter sp.]
MIGQYVYSRNDGASVLGPNTQSIIGYGCIGHTDSLSESELVELNMLSKSGDSISSDQVPAKLRSNYMVKWLRSGRLAVGCNTPLQGVRDHHIAHFYVIDRELALSTLSCAEQWFQLPFITADMNNARQGADSEEVRRQAELLTGMRDTASFEEAGAPRPVTMGLRETLDWFGMSHVRLCRALESLLDAVYFNERQLLVACDWKRAGAMEAMISLIGWMYRLLPLHVRRMTSVAMPYTNQTGPGDYAMVMIPDSNVRDDDYGVYLRPCGAAWRSIASTFDYLYSGRGFIHNFSGKAEIYRNEKAINLYLWQAVQRVLDDPAGMEALEEVYRELDGCLLPDSDHRDLASLDALELFSHELLEKHIDWTEVGGVFTHDNRTLLDWRRMVSRMPLRQSYRQEFEERLMVEVFQTIGEEPEPYWYQELCNVLTGGVNTELAMDLVAMTCVKLWHTGPQAATQLCEEMFAASIPQEMIRNGDPMGMIWEKVLLANGDRAAVWRNFGVSCGEQDAARRRAELARDLLLPSASGQELMERVRKFVSFFEHTERNAVLLRRTVEESVAAWLEKGVLSGTCQEFVYLFGLQDPTARKGDWFRGWESRAAQQITDWLEDERHDPVIYQNVTFDSLRSLQDAFGDAATEEGRRFCERARRKMKRTLADGLERMPASRELLKNTCCLLLDEDFARSGKGQGLYGTACARSLGVDTRRGTIDLPEYVTKEWLLEMSDSGYAHPVETGRVLCGLVEQARQGGLQRKQLSDRERGGGHIKLRENEVALIRDGIYQLFAAGRWALDIKDLKCMIGYVSKDGDGRFDTIMDILFQHYQGEQVLFLANEYVRQREYGVLLRLFEPMAKSERENQRLEERQLQQLMALLKEAYENGQVPVENRLEVAWLSELLYLAGTEKMSAAKRAIQAVNRSKYHIVYKEKKDARPRGEVDAASARGKRKRGKR